MSWHFITLPLYKRLQNIKIQIPHTFWNPLYVVQAWVCTRQCIKGIFWWVIKQKMMYFKLFSENNIFVNITVPIVVRGSFCLQLNNCSSSVSSFYSLVTTGPVGIEIIGLRTPWDFWVKNQSYRRITIFNRSNNIMDT